MWCPDATMALSTWRSGIVSLFCSLTIANGIFVEDYMTESCNAVLSGRTSGRLETSTALTYDNLMSCATTIEVTPGKKIILFFHRFDVEDTVDGACVDVFNVHDGLTASAARLNSGPMCGVVKGYFNMSTSSNAVTLTFTSDNNALYRGFDIMYTEYTSAPCSPLEFACENGLCVPADAACDDVTQCGDYSDEAACTVDEIIEDDADQLPVGLIIGCVIAGLVVLILVIVALYKLYEYYKWRRFIRLSSGWSQTEQYEYPVTDKYKVFDIGKRGRRPPEIQWYCVQGPDPSTGDTAGKRLAEL